MSLTVRAAVEELSPTASITSTDGVQEGDESEIQARCLFSDGGGYSGPGGFVFVSESGTMGGVLSK